MDLDCYDEDNPNLDGDYKAVLQRRREIAEAKKLSSPSTVKPTLKWTESKQVVLAASKKVGVDQLMRLELRDSLFNAVTGGHSSTTVASLLARVKELKVSLASASMRLDNGETLLHRALLKAGSSLADELITAGGEELVLATYTSEVDGNPSENTCLHVACQYGSLQSVQKLVRAIASEATRRDFLMKMALVLPEGQRARKLSCLHIAAKAGKADIVRFLVRECDMPVDLKNNKSDTPLLWAANDGRAEVVELLIGLGARVDEQNDKGSSALHWAVRGRHLAVAEALLDKGKANPNIRRKLGLVCPLVMAAAMAFDDIVRVLIKFGADVNTLVHASETALHYAASEGATDVCQTLIDAGATVDPVDGRGDTPLLEAAAHNHVDAVALLVRLGASVVHANVDSLTVWHYAVSAPSDDMLEALMQLSDCWQQPPANAMMSTASLRAPPREFPPGITPLHLAAEKGDSSKVALMLKSGVDKACRDSKGNTFLHVAALQNHAQILQNLCDDATAAATNEDGNTPLHLACKRGNADAIQVLARKTKLQVANKAGMTPLHEAARSNHIDASAVALLVAQTIQSNDWTLLDAPDKNKNTALHIAVNSGNVQVVKALKPLSVKVANASGNTPLHLAVMKRNEAIFLQLLEDRTSLSKDVYNALNNDRKSILHIAMELKHVNHVKHVVAAGANIGQRGRDGNTAMHLVADLIMKDEGATSSYMQIVKLIVAKSHIWWATFSGMPIPQDDTAEHHELTEMACRRLFLELRNDDGLNALQYAATIGCAALVEYILNMPRVFRRMAGDKGQAFVYDVTNLTPATVTAQERRHRERRQKKPKRNSTTPAKTNSKINLIAIDASASGNAVPEADTELGCGNDGNESPSPGNGGRVESLLELIVSNENIRAAAAVLDVEPVASVVKHYWTAYQWLFGIIMGFHLLHMSVFSVYGPRMMAESLANCSAVAAQVNIAALLTCGGIPAEVRSYVAVEVLLLVAPVGLILFELVDFFERMRQAFAAARRRKQIAASHLKSPAAAMAVQAVGVRAKRLRTDLSTTLGVFLRLCGLGHALFAVAWYVLFRFRMYDQDYALALTLVLGWVFSLHFTRGFKAIHHFNLMFRHMIFRDVAKFLAFFVFILLGFGMAQYTLIRADPANSTIGPIDTLFISFQWLIGMNGFWNMQPDEALVSRYLFAGVLFTVYCILSTVVLLNLLIATMSDSYGQVRDTSALFWKVNSIQMAIDIETLVPTLTRLLRRLPGGRGVLRYDEREQRWLCALESRLRHQKMDGGSDESASDRGNVVEAAVSALDERVTTMQKELSTVTASLEQLLVRVQDNRLRLQKALGSALSGADGRSI